MDYGYGPKLDRLDYMYHKWILESDAKKIPQVIEHLKSTLIFLIKQSSTSKLFVLLKK
jgi:hypothetical protein